VTREEILERLAGIDDPCSISHGRPTDIVSFGLVDAVEPGPPPRVRLRLTEPTCLFGVYFVRCVREVVGADAVVEWADADSFWEPPSASLPSTREE
jgi:metal-sulfur cluster biosynthetic enzyme